MNNLANSNVSSGLGKGAFGRGKFGKKYAKRFNSPTKPPINGITNPGIRRIARRGGVKRISGFMYDETRGVLKTWLENIVSCVLVYTEHARRKTVLPIDVIYALERNGQKLYGYK